MVDIGKKDFSISVFLPCYNEQENVNRTVENALAVLESIGCDYEVIVVNDGSKDNTGKIADEIASKNSHVKAVHHWPNLGYGSAVRLGIKASTKKYIFFTDGDGQFDMKEMPQLIPLMEKYDIVTCYRINRQDPFIRKLNAWCWTSLVCLLFRMRIRDIDCAFKLFRREVFENMNLVSTGALIDAEILARATRKGFKITQVGVHHLPRTAGEQTGAKLRVILRAFKELFKLHKQIRNDIK